MSGVPCRVRPVAPEREASSGAWSRSRTSRGGAAPFIGEDASRMPWVQAVPAGRRAMGARDSGPLSPAGLPRQRGGAAIFPPAAHGAWQTARRRRASVRALRPHPREGVMLAEFKKFLLQTNAMALAVGVIIGGAVGKVVSSLVSDIL